MTCALHILKSLNPPPLLTATTLILNPGLDELSEKFFNYKKAVLHFASFTKLFFLFQPTANKQQHLLS